MFFKVSGRDIFDRLSLSLALALSLCWYEGEKEVDGKGERTSTVNEGNKEKQRTKR